MVGIFYVINRRNHYLTLLKSDSMVPELHRGDIILATKMDNYKVKDIVLLKVSTISQFKLLHIYVIGGHGPKRRSTVCWANE